MLYAYHGTYDVDNILYIEHKCLYPLAALLHVTVLYKDFVVEQYSTPVFTLHVHDMWLV